jgi:hypothetical protein
MPIWFGVSIFLPLQNAEYSRQDIPIPKDNKHAPGIHFYILSNY